MGEEERMNGETRRRKIRQILSEGGGPVPGVALAKELAVSRQVIVQDIALLRANGVDILSTNRGYLVTGKQEASRVFKVIHGDDEVEEELDCIVDLGGVICDVFVYHKVYGIVRADMGIRSRAQVRRYLNTLEGGKSSLLKNVTAGYHYHTVQAENEAALDMIQQELFQRGFLAKLQDYEPVDFWGTNKEESGF